MNRDAVYKWRGINSLGLIPDSVEEAQNNTDKLNAALRQVSRTDTGIYINPRLDCIFTGRVVVDSAHLFGDVGSSMRFTDGTASPNVGIFMRGYLPRLNSVTVRVIGATVRRARECVWVQDGTRGHVIENVRVSGCSGAGFFVDGGMYGQIRGCKVKDNLADGFHHTNGSAFCDVTDCEVDGSGDDYFAVVSYKNQGRVCRHIHHRNIKGNNQHHGGRGLTVVGGRNISYKGFDIRNVKGYGLYVYAESSYNTYGCRDVEIKHGMIDGTGVDTINPEQWAAIRVGDDNNELIGGVVVDDVTLFNIGGPTQSIDNKPNVAGVLTTKITRRQTR